MITAARTERLSARLISLRRPPAGARVARSSADADVRRRGPDDGLDHALATSAGMPPEQTVLELVHENGFEPLDAGDLDESWRLRPGTPTYCRDMTAELIRHGLAATMREDIGQHRADRDAVN
jgi:hypothetical protein